MTGTDQDDAAAPRGSSRGRPRDVALDAAIRDATLVLLSDLGYEQLSIEAVAQKAGVGKTTIYRRHVNKAALVAAALDARGIAMPPPLRTDDLRGRLVRMVEWLAREIAEQEIGLLGATFAGMRADPEFAQRMREILRRDEAAMTSTSDTAAEGGERLSERAASLFNEIAPAVVVHRLLLTGEPCTPSFLEHLVDDILLPLLDRRELES